MTTMTQSPGGPGGKTARGFKSWQTLGTPALAHELSALSATAIAPSNKIGRGGGGGGWGLLCWRASPPGLEGLVGGPYSECSQEEHSIES